MAQDNRSRRTLRLSAETEEVLGELREMYNQSENSIIERSIREFAASRPNAKLSVEKRLSRLEEQQFHIMNLLNSLCKSLNVKTEEYASAENNPTTILQQSEQEFSTSMLRLRTEKI